MRLVPLVLAVSAVFILIIAVVLFRPMGSPKASKSGLPDNPNNAVDYSKVSLKEIYLAGGCFWGVEAYMARIYGVYNVESGYANGRTENPSYEEIGRASCRERV